MRMTIAFAESANAKVKSGNYVMNDHSEVGHNATLLPRYSTVSIHYPTWHEDQSIRPIQAARGSWHLRAQSISNCE
jgi:hypothetical protein